MLALLNFEGPNRAYARPPTHLSIQGAEGAEEGEDRHNSGRFGEGLKEVCLAGGFVLLFEGSQMKWGEYLSSNSWSSGEDVFAGMVGMFSWRGGAECFLSTLRNGQKWQRESVPSSESSLSLLRLFFLI